MRKNKNILKKGMILAAVSTMVVTMAPAIPAYAYGEADSKTGQAAFNAATTESTDYQSWLTGTWQGGTQDFANTIRLHLHRALQPRIWALHGIQIPRAHRL